MRSKTNDTLNEELDYIKNNTKEYMKLAGMMNKYSEKFPECGKNRIFLQDDFVKLIRNIDFIAQVFVEDDIFDGLVKEKAQEIRKYADLIQKRLKEMIVNEVDEDNYPDPSFIDNVRILKELSNNFYLYPPESSDISRANMQMPLIIGVNIAAIILLVMIIVIKS